MRNRQKGRKVQFYSACSTEVFKRTSLQQTTEKRSQHVSKSGNHSQQILLLFFFYLSYNFLILFTTFFTYFQFKECFSFYTINTIYGCLKYTNTYCLPKLPFSYCVFWLWHVMFLYRGTVWLNYTFRVTYISNLYYSIPVLNGEISYFTFPTLSQLEKLLFITVS